MIRRGEIYLVDWSTGRGSEQSGVRPSLVVQNDVGNEFSSTTIVAAITTRRGSTYPFQVAIRADDSGLPKDSVVKCEQLQTIEKARLSQLMGRLDEEAMNRVGEALSRSLGLES